MSGGTSQAQPPFSDAAINEEADIGPPRPTRRRPRAHNFTARRQTVPINRVESTCPPVLLPVSYHDQQICGHTAPLTGSITSPSQARTSEMPRPSHTMTSYSPHMTWISGVSAPLPHDLNPSQADPFFGSTQATPGPFSVFSGMTSPWITSLHMTGRAFANASSEGPSNSEADITKRRGS